MQGTSYTTRGGIRIQRETWIGPYEREHDTLAHTLDDRRGVLLSSSFEFPGRYTRLDMGFVDPPLVFTARDRRFTVEALNARGRVLIPDIAEALGGLSTAELSDIGEDHIAGEVRQSDTRFPEEQRSRQPSIFSVLRALNDLFGSPEDEHLGFYGAFGYDLVFQFEPMRLRLPRPEDQRDLVLYLPDEILIVDHMRQHSAVHRYEFEVAGHSTRGLPRGTPPAAYRPDASEPLPPDSDHGPGEYAGLVRKAKEAFVRGDLFEVVCGQLFSTRCPDAPSTVFNRLRQANPAPYGALINLGEGEFLVSASPEMYVRVEGRRIETCPISGTIARGHDPLEDAERIRELLNSKKDESELTMCTDVDRNDKSRVCVPGSVRVIGRRQIEMYSRLIHTVDHIEGRLREGMDAFDAFLSHAWAVTVTGAPKLWAMRFIEQNEKSPRAWYGGAIGMVHFNGDLNTGLTLRTIRIKDGIAEVRAGATLLYDSVPEDEEAETELKASAMISAIRDARPGNAAGGEPATRRVGEGVNILLVDHEDSFVHTLANYFRQTGANVSTVRTPVPDELFDSVRPDLVVLSPGPGTPKDFDCAATIRRARARQLPIFGVCLGLQALAEAYGGELRQLHVPMHGKPSRIRVSKPGVIFSGLPKEITVGRYHSIFADPVRLPEAFVVTAETEDGVIMAFEHRKEPIAAVQFHPESIMTLGQNAGMRMIENVVAHLPRKAREKAA